VNLLREVDIPAPETRCMDYPHQLSGGMRQRVLIALALAGDPDLLIADEPTTALDPTVQVEILRLLDNLRRNRGMGIILISHDLAVVGEVCERVMVMYGGQVVESGPVERILRIPAHPYTQGLLASRVPAEKGGRRLFSIPGEVPEAVVWPEGCRFHPRCSEKLDRCSTDPPPVVPIPKSEDHDFGWTRCWLPESPGEAG
jgi:oligopeptide/dipeptide ABC transporter ATP-binding protein